MKKLYTGVGFVVWKVGSMLGIPYAKHKLEDRG
jgi:hypothetical protein